MSLAALTSESFRLLPSPNVIAIVILSIIIVISPLGLTSPAAYLRSALPALIVQAP